MKWVTAILDFLRLIFSSGGQAEGDLKRQNKSLEEENQRLADQRDSNVMDIDDARKISSRLRDD